MAIPLSEVRDTTQALPLIAPPSLPFLLSHLGPPQTDPPTSFPSPVPMNMEYMLTGHPVILNSHPTNLNGNPGTLPNGNMMNGTNTNGMGNTLGVNGDGLGGNGNDSDNDNEEDEAKPELEATARKILFFLSSSSSCLLLTLRFLCSPSISSARLPPFFGISLLSTRNSSCSIRLEKVLHLLHSSPPQLITS